MPLFSYVTLLVTIFFAYLTPAYAGRTETATPQGSVVIWTVDYPKYDRAKGNAREHLAARRKFDADLELCKQIPDGVDRADCLTGKDYDGSGYAFQGHRSRLRKACGAALRGDKTTMTECIVGAEKLGQPVPQHYTSFRSLLAVSKGCRGFIQKLGEAYTRFHGAEAIYEGATGRGWGANEPAVCAAYAALMSERGLSVEWASCGTGTSRGAQLSSCLGAPDSDQFKASLRLAPDQCANGQALSIQGRLREAANMSGATLDIAMDCKDVAAVVSANGVAQAADIENALRRDDELRGQRAPREREVRDALLRMYEAQLGCRSSLGEWCKVPRTIPRNLAIADGAIKTVLEGSFDVLEKAGIPRTQQNDIESLPTTLLRFSGLQLGECKPAEDAKFECSYELAIDCQVKGNIVFQGADLFAGELAARICPSLVLTKQRKSHFKWSSREIEVVQPVF